MKTYKNDGFFSPEEDNRYKGDIIPKENKDKK